MVSAVLGWDSSWLLPLLTPPHPPHHSTAEKDHLGRRGPFSVLLALCPSTLTRWKPHFSFLCWIKRAWISLVSIQWKLWFQREPRRKQINMKPKDETILALGCWEAERLLYPLQELNHVKSKTVSTLMEALRLGLSPRATPLPHGPSPPPFFHTRSFPAPVSSFSQHKNSSFRLISR